MRKKKKRVVKIIPAKAVIYASMIGSILSEYEDDEITYTVASMKTNITLMLKSASMTNIMLYTKYIAISEDVWRSSLNKFSTANKKIEIIRVVAVLYDEAKSELNRLCKITDKMIDRFEVEGAGDACSTVDIQLDSSEVALYLIDEVRKRLGKPPRVNKLFGLKDRVNSTAVEEKSLSAPDHI